MGYNPYETAERTTYFLNFVAAPMRIFSLLRSSGDTTNRKIFRAAIIIGTLTLVARAGTVFKEMIVAYAFGRGDALDAFLIAFLLPSFVVGLVAGTMVSALIPVFIEVDHKNGRAAAERLLSSAAVLTAVTLLASALLLGVLAPLYLPYIAHGFSAAKLHLTAQLLYALLPWLVMSGIAQTITYVLNAGERFALPALVPLTTPLLVVVFILSAGRSQGVFTLAAGSSLGSLIECGLLLAMLKAHGTRLRWRWFGFGPELRIVLKQTAPLLASGFLMASAPLIGQSLAAMLASGSVSALAYANRLVGGITFLGTTALSTATLPYFSRMAAQNDWAGCWHTLKRYSALLAATMFPFTLVFIAISRPLVRGLYQRGAFTAADAELVAHLQTLLAIQIPFLMLCALLVRFLSAIRRNDLLLYGSMINLAANVALNVMLMKIWGLTGIALSTSLMQILSALFFAGCTLWILGRHRESLVSSASAHEVHN
jgi:putative peptidoglycan lipid II flippase